MKTFLHSLFFFLLVTQICFAQWYLQNPLITQNAVKDVVLVDENFGWAVGDSGTIIKTTNTGIDWLTQTSNTELQLRGVCFVDINNGWVVGENGTILRTSDGGSNWIMQSSGITENLNDISFSDLNSGLVVGEQGRVLKTNDSGNTWFAQMLGNTITLYGVCFLDTNNGWIVGDNSVTGNPDGIIKRTTDGGTTWTAQSSPFNIQESLYDVTFIDINTGWIGGRNHDGTNPWGEILKTTNGGLTWIAQSCPTQAELSSVYFIDSNNGWATAADRWYGGIKGHIIRTTNGGATWLEQYLGVSKATNGIFFANPSNGIAVGESGTIQISTDGGNTWNSPPGGSTNDWTDVSFTDLNNGMVIGDGGTILRTANGGTSWTQVETGTTNDFTAMSFIDANEGWSVTGIIHGFHTELRDSSFIFHTTDSGETWTKQLTMPLTLFNDVSFVDANNGWAVGIKTDSIWWTSSYGIILRTTNGGVTWNQTINDTIYGNKVYFVDENNGWILSNEYWKGRILRTTDGGDTWALQFETTNAYYAGLNDIVCFDLNKAFAVGIFKQGSIFPTKGLIVKTTDGGANWTQTFVSLPWDYDWIGLKGVFFSSASEGMVVGVSGVIIQTTDGGISWINHSSGTTNTLSDVYFTDLNNGWVVGDNGIILHTTNGGVVPVELNSFTATANGKEVTLNWSTATELNNQGFEVQRKFGSNDFVTVGSIKGHGTTTTPNNYIYVDKLTDAGKYFYRLKQIDYDGKYEYSQTVEVNWSPFTNYKLEQNYPNPFNPTTTIGFGIPEKGNVKLSVLNILGEEMKVLLNEEKEAGYHAIDFNASDLPSGVYFYKLKAGSFVETKKMILLR